jgi:hypothetical protein
MSKVRHTRRVGPRSEQLISELAALVQTFRHELGSRNWFKHYEESAHNTRAHMSRGPKHGAKLHSSEWELGPVTAVDFQLNLFFFFIIC